MLILDMWPMCLNLKMLSLIIVGYHVIIEMLRFAELSFAGDFCLQCLVFSV